jgi:hypothetical protein
MLRIRAAREHFVGGAGKHPLPSIIILILMVKRLPLTHLHHRQQQKGIHYPGFVNIGLSIDNN